MENNKSRKKYLRILLIAANVKNLVEYIDPDLTNSEDALIESKEEVKQNYHEINHAIRLLNDELFTDDEWDAYEQWFRALPPSEVCSVTEDALLQVNN